MEVRGDVDRHHVVPGFQLDMAERRGGAGDAGIADENVDLAVAFMQRGAEACDAIEIGEVQRHQRGAAAVLPGSRRRVPQGRLCVRATATICAPARASARAVA